MIFMHLLKQNIVGNKNYYNYNICRNVLVKVNYKKRNIAFFICAYILLFHST